LNELKRKGRQVRVEQMVSEKQCGRNLSSCREGPIDGEILEAD
jgi:hypothetical protein